MNEHLAASVRQCLLNLSRTRGDEFQLILTHYAIERLLYRLSQSEAGDRFLLKGAMLFNLWVEQPHRPTRDLDLSGQRDPASEKLRLLFQKLCTLSATPDGLVFDADSVQVMEIREQQEYDGQRVRLVAHLGNARIPLQIDIGFGDAVSPGSIVVQYPTLLDFPAPRLRAYPKETVVAEKVQAMVALGMANSRMKDFYDLWVMARTFSFAGELLVKALRATFARRRTPIPTQPPTALTSAFAHHQQKRRQWQAFLSRNGIDLGDVTFAQVVDKLSRFLMPPLSAARTLSPFPAMWVVDDWHER